MSDRVKATGLESILCDIVKYSFAGELCTPPPGTRSLLEKLIAPENTLCYI